MELYGLEVTNWLRWRRGHYFYRRSIKPILPDIIGQYLLFCMSNINGSTHWFMDTYIDRFSLIMYYHSLLYNLGHDNTTLLSYCYVRCNARSSPRVTFLSDNSTTSHHNRNAIITANIGQVILSKYDHIGQVIDQSALSLYIWHIIIHFMTNNKVVICHYSNWNSSNKIMLL